MSEINSTKLAIFMENPLKKQHLNQNKNELEVILSPPQYNKRQLQFCKRIEELDLSNQGLMEIKQEKINNIWIIKLDLSHNCIQQYGNEFKILQNLRILDISNNYVKILPLNFNKFHPQLQNLYISHNNLSTLPQMPDELIQLNIEYNQIHQFPQNLQNSIQILLLSGNPIYELKYLSELKEFSIDWVIYLGWSERIKGNQLQQFQNWMSKENQATFQNMIKHFLGEQFNYKNSDQNGNTILHQAALKQHLGVILGCSSVIDKNSLNNQKQSPIQLALFSDKYQSVKCLLSLNVNLNSVKISLFQQNLVIISLIKQQINLMQGFLQHGTDPNEQDKEGNTALHYLINKWPTFQFPEKYAALLLQQGACPLILNKQGLSPLHIGVKCGYIQAVQFALEYKGQLEICDRCSHPFDITQVTGKEKFSVFDICMQSNQVQMCFSLLRYCQYYIRCKPITYCCLWKLIVKHNRHIFVEYFQKSGNTLNQSGEQLQERKSKHACCLNLTKQLNASFMKINLPNQFTMSRQRKDYFSIQDAPLLKEGDNDHIEYLDSSIDSHEETKGLQPVNWSRYDCNNEMNAPKLCIQSNTITEKESRRENSQIRQIAEAYYNEYILNDNLLKKEEILIILLKLNFQINVVNQLRDQSIQEIFIQIVEDYSFQCEILQEQQSSIKQESFFYKDLESIDQGESTCQITLMPSSINYLKQRFDQWTLEYLLRFTTKFSEHSKLSEIHQFELFQL
ncbi:unnamed protein product (macronuclear) [Paramecium tetraurelia]|uniref:Uncharacterized protein n=1 Tax=Paramecium tetraurelia TaxID=5888 RepID=A0BCZ8_PARTE|nr:uncharacterized protein GSPATT00004509001 [Paramecium tetraurelia]CAK56415.1 unnamed protein product [Paramecium tetraurelia]|eukprot:XP_001423813.1 hypothetical protein (macronuclear) [Paramecium tetraurelia strain d4-2]